MTAYKTIVITAGRSGSRLLCEALIDSGLTCAFEPLCDKIDGIIFKKMIKRMYDIDIVGENLSKEQRDIISKPEYIEEVLKKYDVAKILYWHLWQYPEIEQYLVSREDVKIIHLIRKNKLAAFTSLEVAKKTNKWHVYKDENYNLNTTVNIDINNFNKYLEAVRINIHRYENMFTDKKLTIRYEDMILNWEQVISDVQSFIGVNQKVVSKKSKRTVNKKLSKVIENYKELKSTTINNNNELDVLIKSWLQ